MSVDTRQIVVGVHADTTLSRSATDAACTQTGGGAHCAHTPAGRRTSSCTSSSSSGGGGGRARSTGIVAVAEPSRVTRSV
jgi:hypothetical protein